MQTQTQGGEAQREDGGRDWGDVSISLGTPKTSGKPSEARAVAWTRFFLRTPVVATPKDAWSWTSSF